MMCFSVALYDCLASVRLLGGSQKSAKLYFKTCHAILAIQKLSKGVSFVLRDRTSKQDAMGARAKSAVVN